MSESIHAGYLPLWNPYINYGLPQYGDMSSGFWSPVTWLVASTVGYNVYTFTIEEAFYLFLAGWGMYRLTTYWNLKKPICIIAGVAYMCCGYMVGHLQHFNWISGAAFFPWCFLTYLQVIRITNWQNLLKSALAFSLFFYSAHPGIIIGGIYFFALTSLAFGIKTILDKDDAVLKITTLFSRHLLLLLSILPFVIGGMAGYLEILPHITRGEKTALNTIGEPATLQSWISLLLPLATTKNASFFATDISIRNCYIGLLLLLVLISGIFSKNTKWQHLFLLTGAFFSFLSVGGIFNHISYQYLPLIGYVRLTGEFRIYVIFSAILFAAIQFNQIDKDNAWQKLRPGYYFLQAILGAVLLFSIYRISFAHQSILFGGIMQSGEWTLNLKQLVDHLTFYDTLLFQAIIQIIFLTVIYHAIRKGRKRIVFYAAIVELITASLFNLPFTGVGKTSPREVQQLLNNSPRGIPIPPRQPTSDNDTIATNQVKTIGDWSFYSKQIGATYQVPYPINLTNTESFFKGQHVEKINKEDYIYVIGDSSKEHPNMQVVKFTPNNISIEVNASFPSKLVLKQNYYPAWRSTINDSTTEIHTSEKTFLSVSLESGQQKISFRFINNKIVVLVYLNLLLFVFASAILGFRILWAKKVSNPK